MPTECSNFPSLPSSFLQYNYHHRSRLNERSPQPQQPMSSFHPHPNYFALSHQQCTQTIKTFSLKLSPMKLHLFGHNFYFYQPSLFKDRLMAHWQQYYKENSPNWNQKYQFSFEEWMIVLFMIMMVSRAYITNFGSPELINNYEFRLYMGSFYHLIHSTPFRVETLTALWAFNQLSVLAVIKRFRLKRFRWMALVESLESGPESGFLVGFSREQSYDFQKRIRPLMRVIITITHQSSIVMSVVFVIVFARYYPLLTFMLYCLPWTIINYWTTQTVAGTIYIQGTYVMLLKLVVKIKLDSYTQKIDQIWQCGTTRTMMWSSRLLRPLAEQLRDIEHYNHFWRDMISVQMFWRILIINFAAYIVFFVKPSLATACYFSVWFNEISTLMYLIRNISLLVPQMGTIRKKLQSGLCRNQRKIPLSCRIKISSFVETLSTTKGIGFCFSNNITCEPVHVVVILREMTSLFLLLVQIVSR